MKIQALVASGALALLLAPVHVVAQAGASPKTADPVSLASEEAVRRQVLRRELDAKLAEAIATEKRGAMAEAWGWRSTYIGLGVFCLVMSLPLLAMFRIRAPLSDAQSAPQAPQAGVAGAALRPDRARPFGMSPNLVMVLLCGAGVACCVAMSMPQVHIVAYCGELGYGSAAGAQMLSLMLGFGIVSRLISGWVADRIGGVRTLLAGAALQAVALSLYLPFDGLGALYVIAILFGLFQGGIVPSYALVVREFFPAAGSATRIALVINSTLLGMALGGWLSGSIFDLTGSYEIGRAHV